jgi:hypothetical protein
MTVDELITRIIAAYPGANLEAMKSFKLVFYARLKPREGESLAEATTEVLKTIALEVADAAAWRETGKPIALTARQRQLAVQRAISLQRRCEHGPPERLGADAWWAQISAIAARSNVAPALDEWQQGEWRA